MIERPFDMAFVEAVESYNELDCDEGWRGLVAGSDSAVWEHLYLCGYTEQEVEDNLCRISTMSVNELVLLRVAYEEFYVVVRFLLQQRGTRETFEKAVSLCGSVDCDDRVLGVEILTRLTGRNFPDETKNLLRKMIKVETDSVALEVLVYALYHHEITDCCKDLLRLVGHSNERVRKALAIALYIQNDLFALEGLAALCEDHFDQVRDWATYGLKQFVCCYYDNGELDMVPEACELFYMRLADPCKEVRYEALAGLSLFGDQRALEPLKRALQERPVRALALEAAAYMADESLLPLIAELEDNDVYCENSLANAKEVYSAFFNTP